LARTSKGASVDRIFQQVLSIGQNCRARHHVRRTFGKHSGRKGVFDWQITPASAFLEYLSRDFRGMFDRADLVARNGEVFNDRFGTNHVHEFPKGIQPDDIDRHYPAARKRHDHWCAFTRRVMTNDLSALFVLAAPVPPDTLEEISSAIARLKRNNRFLVLNGPENDVGSDWTGNQAVWDQHLAPFEIHPPMSVKAEYVFHRIRANVARAVPEKWRL
jgi:hypothetical protein